MNLKIFERADSLEIRELKAELLSKRNLGNVLFEIKQLGSDFTLEQNEDLIEVLDLFVSQVGYVGLGDRWKEITPEATHKILVFILTKDLAYSSKIMPIAAAEKFSHKIFNLFKSKCKFFTNAAFVNNYSALSAWDSLTEATFDTGVIFVSNTEIGMLWVKDED